VSFIRLVVVGWAQGRSETLDKCHYLLLEFYVCLNASSFISTAT